MVHDESDTLVPSNNIIKFNNTNLATGISYDPNIGEFTVPSNGQYIIHWWVNVRNEKQSYDDCERYALGIELHQFYPFDVLIAHSSTHNRLSYLQTGTISGNAIFNATGGSTFRFINSSAIDFTLVPNDLYSAAVSITRIN